MAGRECPVRNNKNQQTSNCNWGVVEGLNSDRVRNRQREEDGDGHHPKNGNPANNDPIATQVERPLDERLSCQSHPKEDRKGISNIEANRCYRHHGVKCHYASKRLQYN